MKTLLYGVLFALLIKILTSKRMDVNQLKALLIKAGFPVDTIKLFVAQAAHETGGFDFSSNVARTNNNLTGIKYIGKPKVQKNAIQGLKSTEGNFYAHFPTLLDWANDYKRILSFGSKPIKATTPGDLVDRLKENSYFTGDYKSYLAGVNHFFQSL